EFRWIQYRAQYAKGEGKAQITFSDAVMPYLTQLKSQFIAGLNQCIGFVGNQIRHCKSLNLR
ncbi:RepB family plasmid replication initiator protein, partial [Escherichia coli]